MADPVTDLEAAEQAGSINSPLVVQIKASLSAIAKMLNSSGSFAPVMTDAESATLPLIAIHAGLNGDDVSNYAAAILANDLSDPSPTVIAGLQHAQASLTALLLGAAEALGIT